MRRLVMSGIAVLTIALPACEGAPSTLDPEGPGAARIEGLWWLIFWIATAVFLVVLALLVVAIVRGRRAVDVKKQVPWGEPFIVVSGVALPALILVSVFVVSLSDMAALSRTADDTTLTIEVVSHDWWWEARYPNGAVTANEMHIPVGQPVRFELATADVIHSFWVPRLQGKVDHVTGRVNNLWIEADEPGRYRGQCAEFCGLQHAKMAFYIVADPPAQFDQWLAEMAEPAEEPIGTAKEGRQVFLNTTCAGCHAIEGTPSDARVGPDLTHLARRDTLMAGIIPNTRQNLADVITDPQSIKPGVAMPPTELTPDQLDAVLDYLQGLD